jgi:predicted HicB family RNase H-like nuclease
MSETEATKQTEPEARPPRWPPRRKTRFMLYIPPRLYQQVTIAAEEDGCSRSDWIVHACLEKLVREGRIRFRAQVEGDRG